MTTIPISPRPTSARRHETRALLRAHLAAASAYRHATRHCPICHRLLRLAMESGPEPDPGDVQQFVQRPRLVSVPEPVAESVPETDPAPGAEPGGETRPRASTQTGTQTGAQTDGEAGREAELKQGQESAETAVRAAPSPGAESAAE
nr:DUF6274 family protein [Streptomyces gossypii]